MNSMSLDTDLDMSFTNSPSTDEPTNIDHMADVDPRVFFRIEEMHADWDSISMKRVTFITDIRRAIKEYYHNQLFRYDASMLIIKAKLAGRKHKPVLLKGNEHISIILERLNNGASNEAEEDTPMGEVDIDEPNPKLKYIENLETIRKSFSESILLFVQLPEVMKIDLTNDPKMLEQAVKQMIQEAIQSHELYKEDIKKIIENQKEKLGSFYSQPLPYGTAQDNLALAMFGQVLDLEPTAGSEDKRTFQQIIEGDIGRKNNYSVVTMVARSGSGKTTSVVNLAKKYFVIYASCTTDYNPESSEFSDVNFRLLAGDVEKECTNLEKIYNYQVGGMTTDDIRQFDSELFQMAKARVQLEFLARQLFLLVLFEKVNQLEPKDFFREQMNDGRSTIGSLVTRLKSYTPRTIRFMIVFVEKKLNVYLGNRTLVIALDEAQVAETDILKNKLLSRSMLQQIDWVKKDDESGILDESNISDDNYIDGHDNNKGTYSNDEEMGDDLQVCTDTEDSSDNNKDPEKLFDPQNRVLNKYRHGLFPPLVAALSTMKATLVVLGTSFSLTNVDHVYSAVSKINNERVNITNFPICDEDGVSELLGKLIDLKGCKIQPEKKQKLVGRFRFTTSVVSALLAADVHEPGKSKQEILDDAIDSAIKKVKADIQTEVHKLKASNMWDSDYRLLSRVVIAFKLTGGCMTFTKTTEAAFINRSLCALRLDIGHKYSFWIEEPLVIEVMEKLLKKRKIHAKFNEYLEYLNSIRTNLGIGSSTRRGIFECLVRENLKRFNGTPIQDLPFLKNIKEELPKWCKETILLVDKSGTAKELGYSDGLRGDQEYFEACRLNEMLYPNHFTGPDIALLLHKDKNNFLGGLGVAIKFESSPLSSKANELNNMSCDLRKCFLKKDGMENEALKVARDNFLYHGYPDKMKGILHIHLVFPKIQGGTPKSYVKERDVFVYIDCSNMDTFFHDSKSINGDMQILRDIIKYVVDNKKN